MNIHTIIVLVLAIAGTAVNIRGAVERHNAKQTLGLLIVITSVIMAVINNL